MSFDEAAKMDDILTVNQMEKQFSSEWILVADPNTDEALAVQSGKVCWHSKDRDEVYRKALELRLQRFAILYAGQIPENTAVVL